ncbi:hypothetical protein [Nocardia nepalensis]|uniref:hypothetical protein n=1 Tax=Nocardia nepalensis TaxID=3375448 RepID=UPI003B66CEAA
MATIPELWVGDREVAEPAQRFEDQVAGRAWGRAAADDSGDRAVDGAARCGTIAPPLTATEDELALGLFILDQAIGDAVARGVS